MFRLWGKIMKNNDLIDDEVFELEDSNLSLKEKTDLGIKSLCYHFDLQKPMWLSDNDNDFNMLASTRFFNQHFIETIDFDYFEIEVIENK